MGSKSTLLLAMLVLFVGIFDANATTVFFDDFESDTTGTFPSKWTIQHKDPSQINADAVVVDRTTAPGAIYEGNKSVRINFFGGSGSGIKTTFGPVTQGIVTFFCRIDGASDDLQIMGLHNFSNTELEGSHLITATAQPFNDVWEYSISGASVGVTVIFGEYARFDIHFDTYLGAAALYINNQMIGNYPLENPSDGLTTIRSVDDSGPGTAEWYLDKVIVTPEPATLILLGLGAATTLKLGNKKTSALFAI